MAQEKPAAPKKVLLLTNVDRGEANVFLAAADSLALQDATLEIHFATFGGLEEAVATVTQNVKSSVPGAKPIILHEIAGLPMSDGLQEYMAANNVAVAENKLPLSFTRPLGFWQTLRAIRDTIPIFIPYTAPRMSEIVLSIEDIIKKVNPDLVVVDSLMTAGLTACYHLNVPFTCLSPNSIKEFAAPLQPKAAGLWKYPALFSGYPYPIPWYLRPVNVFFTLYVAKAFIGDSHRKGIIRHLASENGIDLRTPVDLLRNRPDDLQILVSTIPELDFPSIKPDHVVPCGPIVLKPRPSDESDPELDKWLRQGPTIYVNLGSICIVGEKEAVQLAAAFRTVLQKVEQGSEPRKLQLLWKLKKSGEYKTTEPGSAIYKELGEYIDQGRVKISSWIRADPAALLQTGQVVCSVHHGGANSFNEAVIAGVPHVVLPQWTDCYDYAARVEMLGIGRIGNRSKKPCWSAVELAEEMMCVVDGDSAASMKEKAVEMAAKCDAHGDGATNAAKAILAQLS